MFVINEYDQATKKRLSPPNSVTEIGGAFTDALAERAHAGIADANDKEAFTAAARTRQWDRE